MEKADILNAHICRGISYDMSFIQLTGLKLMSTFIPLLFLSNTLQSHSQSLENKPEVSKLNESQNDIWYV